MLETPGSLDFVDSFGQSRQDERSASWDTVSDIKFLGGQFGIDSVVRFIAAISSDVVQQKDTDDSI